LSCAENELSATRQPEQPERNSQGEQPVKQQTIERKLAEASEPSFWGQLQIDYQAGQPVVVRKIETTKLTNDEDNNRYGTQRSK
jgi:hypothetical protein